MSQITPNATTNSKRPTTPPLTPPCKRMKTTGSGQIGELVHSVDKLVNFIGMDANTTVTVTISPLRKKAWDMVKTEEGLSPISLSRALRVFREDDCVKEYLSFDVTSEEEHEARSFWLQDEIVRANGRV